MPIKYDDDNDDDDDDNNVDDEDFFKRFFMNIIVEASLELKEVFYSFFSIYSGYGKSRPACTEASP